MSDDHYSANLLAVRSQTTTCRFGHGVHYLQNLPEMVGIPAYYMVWEDTIYSSIGNRTNLSDSKRRQW
jgi:hypothetical protein